MQEVPLPPRATVNEWFQLVKVCAEFERAPGPVRLVATHCSRFDPLGTTLLASAMVKRKGRSAESVEWLPPKDEGASAFLEEIGFNRLAQARGEDIGAGSLALRQMRKLDVMYLKNVSDLIARNVPGTSDDAAFIIRTCLSELLQNVVEHSGSDVGAFIHARYFAYRRNVQIAVVDRGIGIPAALRKARVQGLERQRDADVLVAAVTRTGLSSRLSGRFGGLGLKLVLDYARQGGGRLTAISQGAKVTFDAKGHRVAANRFYFSGSAIVLDFRPQSQPVDPEATVF